MYSRSGKPWPRRLNQGEGVAIVSKLESVYDILEISFLRAGAALIWAEEEEVGWVGDPGREEGEKVAEQALWL